MRTDWAGSSMAVAQRLPEYAPTVSAMAARLRAANGTEPIDPDKVDRAFLQIAELNAPPSPVPRLRRRRPRGRRAATAQRRRPAVGPARPLSRLRRHPLAPASG
jgi:hypothetical protein